MTLRIQLFQPIDEPAISAWLAENSHIDVKGFSVSAGASKTGEKHPLSLCAILYQDSSGAAPAAMAAAEQLIAEVTAADPGPPVGESRLRTATDDASN